ncbi:hypothetical protein BDQ12DRAFT_240208 [Crucibulum laeve]|uniref:Uncharacterized protein n=1 Tax=Crucibulum laeve TaxID=68775 RepID=A0A5C3LWJ6_9AGAR|nr:hypothetical protein BDQ12DRAFT_240208 [Crucibulum laeve]
MYMVSCSLTSSCAMWSPLQVGCPCALFPVYFCSTVSSSTLILPLGEGISRVVFFNPMRTDSPNSCHSFSHFCVLSLDSKRHVNLISNLKFETPSYQKRPRHHGVQPLIIHFLTPHRR